MRNGLYGVAEEAFPQCGTVLSEGWKVLSGGVRKALQCYFHVAADVYPCKNTLFIHIL